jgi:hypothetical protein
MLRGSRDDYPTSVTDGELLAWVDVTTANFTCVDLNINTAYVSLWSVSADNTTFSTTYLTASIGGEPMETVGNNLGLLALILLPLGIMYGMFRSKEMMLGFPAGIAWWLLGAYAYGQSTTPWGDWQYYLFFASMFFGVFSIYAAYTLRTKKRDLEEGDEFIDESRDELRFIDEGNSHNGNRHNRSDLDADDEKPRKRIRDIRERAERRRARWD